MLIDDLTHILNEYHKHFGSKIMEGYFKSIIKLSNKKGEKTNALSKKKIINNSR